MGSRKDLVLQDIVSFPKNCSEKGETIAGIEAIIRDYSRDNK